MKFDHTKIKELRTAHNLTVRALADAIGVHANVISQWEVGRTMPSMTSLEAMCTRFGIPADYFFVPDEG